VITELAPPAVELWRDHEPGARSGPGMRLGAEPVTADAPAQARQAYDNGVRRARLDRPVRLDGGDPDAVRLLALVRELTAYGIVVDWRLDLGPLGAGGWRPFGHLYPPAELDGLTDPEESLRAWAASFYICKFVYRIGPGFVQVRDRRTGTLNCLTIDDPEYRDAIPVLLGGAPRTALPPAMVADFEAEGLVGTVGEQLWWLPYRVRRWPFPSTVV